MADLNVLMNKVHQEGSQLENSINSLISNYEKLYQESSRDFNTERRANGSVNGLEDFYRLVQTVRRNKDVLTALLRGIKSLRPLAGFHIVVEEDATPVPVKKQKKKPEITPESFQDVKIEESVGDING